MAPASLSTEGRIITSLAALRMNRKEFVRICQSLNVPVSESLISLCLSGRKTFSQWTGIKLTEVMNELVALRDHHGIALNWSSSEGIASLLIERRMKLATEVSEQP